LDLSSLFDLEMEREIVLNDEEQMKASNDQSEMTTTPPPITIQSSVADITSTIRLTTEEEKAFRCIMKLPGHIYTKEAMEEIRFQLNFFLFF